MATINDIEKTAKLYADARSLLAGRLTELNDAIEHLQRMHLDGIKRATHRAAALEIELRDAIKASPELFLKPRSVVLHGVKCGFQKQPGRLAWENAKRVVELIKKHFPDKVATWIKTTEKPVRKALITAPAADLRKISVQVIAAGDAVLVEDTTTDIDKLVSALIKEKKEAAEEGEE